MTEEEEVAYTQGQQMVYMDLLLVAIRGLGYEHTESARVKWMAERAATVEMLRSLCREYGDNDWTDDLHLADVIDKHLISNLRMNYEANQD